MIEARCRGKWCSGADEGDEGDVPSILTIHDRPLLLRSFGVFEIGIGMQLGSEQEDKI